MRLIEMTLTKQLPADDLERLSAYIDGELSPAETAELEARLSREADLRSTLLELRSVVKATRSVPPLRLPRSFTLTPEMAGVTKGFRFPVLQLASAMSALAFVVLVGLDLFGSQFAAQRAASPAAEAQMLEVPAEEPPALAAEASELAMEDASLGAAEAPAAAMLEQEAPPEGEGEPEEGAMKFAGTPMPTAGEELRAMADEAGQTLASTEPAAPATSTAAPSGETANDAVQIAPRGEPEGALAERASEPRSSLLRVGEIILASLSLLLAALSLFLRRRTA
jgi:negative regulator of sigma E activity